MSQQEQHPSADSQDKTQEIEGVVHNDKLLVCRHCNCKILRPGMGKLVENKEFRLPVREQNSSSSSTQSRWWCVDDQFKFENIGFTKDVSSSSSSANGTVVKFLVCADCELEAIGYHIVQEKPLAYYICTALVKEQS